VQRYVINDRADTLRYRGGGESWRSSTKRRGILTMMLDDEKLPHTAHSMRYRNLTDAFQHKPGFQAAVGPVMQGQRSVHRQSELPRNREA
jgi:hypothetical protein